MVLQYDVCDVELPNPGNFPYPGKHQHPGKYLYPSFLQVFLYNLILGLPYPGKHLYPINFPYPIKTSISQVCIYFLKATIIRAAVQSCTSPHSMISKRCK